MLSTDEYREHARMLRQMARSLELSSSRQHRIINGDDSTVSTIDRKLVATFFNSIFGHPAGHNLTEQLSSNLAAGQDRGYNLLGFTSITAKSSEWDETITFEFRAFPNKEMHTAYLMNEAANFALKRANANPRQLAPPARTPLEIGR